MKYLFRMLNRFTKTGWLFPVTFAIVLNGCATAPQDGEKQASASKERPAKYLYAVELLKRKEYDKAYDVLMALEADYQHADLYNNIAIIKLNKKQFDKAKIYSEKSVNADPNNYISQNIHGVVLRNLGEFDSAVKAYNKSISGNPGYAAAYLNLAILYDVFIDNPKQALPYYTKYSELSSDDKNVEKWMVDVKRRIK